MLCLVHGKFSSINKVVLTLFNTHVPMSTHTHMSIKKTQTRECYCSMFSSNKPVIQRDIFKIYSEI